MIKLRCALTVAVIVALSDVVMAQQPVSFAAAACLPLGSSPGGSPIIADLVGGPLPEILITDPNSNFLRIMQTSSNPPTFVTITLPGPAFDAKVADLDGDSDNDIVVERSGTVTVLLKTGGSTFSLSHHLMSTTMASNPVDLVDLDGDGDLDIVRNQNRLLNDGAGGFSASAPLGLTPLAFNLKPGDFDGDGDMDFVGLSVVNPPFNLELFLNNGTGSFTYSGSTPLTGGSPFIVAGDVNADGIDDVVASYASPQVAELYLGTSSALFVSVGFSPTYCTPGASSPFCGVSITPVEFTLVDVDSDGDLDVALYSSPSTAIRIFTYDASGVQPFTLANSISTSGAQGLSSGDIERDGDKELIWRVSSTNNLSVCLSLNLTPTPPTVLVDSGGNNQVANAGQAFVDPLLVRVTTPAGLPLSCWPVTFSGFGPASLSTAGVVLTDEQGYASDRATAGTSSGGIVVSASAPGGLGTATFDLDVRKLDVSWNPSTGNLLIDYRHENAGVPIIVAGDLLLPAPGSVASMFGEVHTSILARGPSFAALDGLGLFGPADPTVVASPSYLRNFHLSAPLSGFTFVFEVYGIDLTYTFPMSVFISNPVTVTF